MATWPISIESSRRIAQILTSVEGLRCGSEQRPRRSARRKRRRRTVSSSARREDGWRRGGGQPGAAAATPVQLRGPGPPENQTNALHQDWVCRGKNCLATAVRRRGEFISPVFPTLQNPPGQRLRVRSVDRGGHREEGEREQEAGRYAKALLRRKSQTLMADFTLKRLTAEGGSVDSGSEITWE